MRPSRPGLFAAPDGRSLAVTFALVSSLFLLWGFCNGMIDTMDKHFQDQLHLTKAQSAWVQFAHYMGYSLMALPAGLLTRRFGYKGGIVAGLLLVAVGGFWFVPATGIGMFWAFLLGVCLIAMGLTVLETVANPYTTVLGPREFAATRINLAQSCNGIGWILGPIVGGAYFYSEGGVQKAHGQLFVPYLGVGIVVVALAVLFLRAPVPEVPIVDEFHTDDEAPIEARTAHRAALPLLFLNVAAIGLSLYLVLQTILPALGAEGAVPTAAWTVGALVAISLPLLLRVHARLSPHSIWRHPHFSGATLAQFVYVAAQAGIFSFFINSMTVDKHTGFCLVPALSTATGTAFEANGFTEHRVTLVPADLPDPQALARRLAAPNDPETRWLAEHLPAADRAHLADPAASLATVADALLRGLNDVLRQQLEPGAGPFHDPQRFAGIPLSPATQQLLANTPDRENDRLRLSRLLLADALPGLVRYDDSTFAISDKGASLLSSFAFGCFLLGRLVGAWRMKRRPAHSLLGLFSLANVAVCALIVADLGWLSALGVFASYFFMSISFPTIFALGIHGLGAQAKKQASAFLVMSITGGALMPKFMGWLGDVHSMAAGFWMPLGCFLLIALYAFAWPQLRK